MSLVFHLIHGARQPTAKLGLLVAGRVLIGQAFLGSVNQA